MSNFGKGIPLSIGFDLGAKIPIDSRTVVDTIADRDLLVTRNLVYEGLTVYVKAIKTEFRYNGSEWIELDDFYSKSEIDTKLNDAVIGNVNLTNYYTRGEVDSKIADIDDCFYVGDTEPNDDKIWFSYTTSSSSPTYDDPIISELFACIQSLQDQIYSLQAEVEYLKIHGGGGSTPDTPSDDDTTYFALLLEDGSPLLLEDGGLLLLETNSSNITIEDALLLENNEPLLIDDNTYLKY